MAYKKIADYGIIGNGLTLAHIGVDGSIDWFCLPYMDSPSVFTAILDDKKGGRFRVQPEESWDSVQSYLPNTNVLTTRFRTKSGEAEVTDFFPSGPKAEKFGSGTILLRRIQGLTGRIPIKIECSPRFDYSRHMPLWETVSSLENLAKGPQMDLRLFSTIPLKWQEENTRLELSHKQTVWLGFAIKNNKKLPTEAELEQLLDSTTEYWQNWTKAQETGKYPSNGFWQENLDRSALVLKLLQFRKTGAIAAAASCSLPTIIYGERNWDYRFSWIRDTSMTLTALYELGHTHEVSLYLEWLKRLAAGKDSPDLDILYQLQEPIVPDGEFPLDHLDGYKGSRPVLTGQYNIGQNQHDIYGELLEMLFAMSRLVGKIDPDYWDIIRKQVDHVVKIWRDKDNGIWELRTGPHHVTHSKVMCWTALDRGIKIAQHYGFPADLESWKTEREAVRKDVLENGYNSELGIFTQHYDTVELDAALLQIPLVNFLPADDPRMVSTISAIEKELMVNGLPLRYKNDDGLPGQEHGWLICLFWYLRCLIRQGRFDEVESHLRRVERYANHLGLFGEEFDTTYNEITGNFPQAFSHIGYSITVLEFINAKRKIPSSPAPSFFQKATLLFKPLTLSPILKEKKGLRINDPGGQVKKIMNVLRGQFYDGQQQRVEYDLIRQSDYYENFQLAVAGLREFAPSSLKNDSEKIAFWCNVFNTLVIHGVIELGIRNSVKEVPFYFERVRYDIGGELYTLADIEHGILRANAVPPFRIRRRFKRDDIRNEYSVLKTDQRIHFALVCASRTCPPIEAFEAPLLDEQLDASARVFINATSRLDMEKRTLFISQIFQWYRKDFHRKDTELIKYLAGYFYDLDKAAWLQEHTANLDLRYLPYDWRLNR